MSDILSVFGILLAVFTYFEALYHDEVHKCFEIQVLTPNRSNKLNYQHIRRVIFFKQYPLLAVSTIISAIMLPVSGEILSASIVYISQGTATYDISCVTIILINSAFLIITFFQIVNLIKLYNKKKKLNYKQVNQ
jgi:hypothetical protein